MTDVLQLLWDISHTPTFAMLEASLRQQAGLAFARGVDWLLAAQVILDGKRTVWTAQHHPLSAEPVAARKYEQISLISTESAAVMQLLLATVPQQAGVVPALCAGIDWLQRQQIRNTIWQRHATGSQLIEQPGAMIWARFYSLTTQQPVFFDRDGQVYQDVRQLSLERQQGYAWYQTDPKNLLRAWEQQPALQAQCQQLDVEPPAAAYRNGTNLMSMFQRYSLTMMARPPLQE
jgi:PelA/Pel-15E family pectate lyase